MKKLLTTRLEISGQSDWEDKSIEEKRPQHWELRNGKILETREMRNLSRGLSERQG